MECINIVVLNFNYTMKALGVIPVRMESTRFPGKPLAVFFGKTMIEHTYAAVRSSKLLSKVVVASDSERLLRVIKEVGGDTVLTGACNTGTDRVVQALHLMDPKEMSGFDVVVNVQGDEPGVDPRHIDKCIEALRGAGPNSVMSTLATPLYDEQGAHSRNVVKCVADCNRCASIKRIKDSLLCVCTATLAMPFTSLEP